MATVVNGGLPVPPSDTAPPSPGKRKRDPTPPEAPASNHGSRLNEREKQERLVEALKDLLQVLYGHDSDLGILRHPLPEQQVSEPNTKRPKLSGPSNGVKTIESRILSHEYNSPQALLNDVEVAGESIVAQRHKSGTPSGDRDQTTFYTEFVNRIRQFKWRLNSLLCRPPFRDLERGKPESSTLQIKGEDNDPQNILRGDKTMLTLWSNVGRGRHLFSSLQQPSAGVDSIEQANLPDTVTISKAIPYNPLSFEPKTRNRTLGEVFPPRSSLPNLEPPRKSDVSSKRSPVVEWLTPVDSVAISASKLEERKGYSALPIPMAQWTNYGYDLPGFPIRREKCPDLMHVPKQQTRINQPESSLFREAYSSFAPFSDSSRSGASRRTKSQVWWSRTGARHMHRFLSSGSTDVEAITAQLPEITLDPDGLEEAVKSFTPEPLEPAKTEENSTNSDDEDTESVLQEISELLRTLDSFRHLRQLGPGTSSLHDADRPSIAEVRTTPSALELETYNVLKSSLSAMIAILPPHLVAKLNGEQLSAINVSKNIVLDNVDYPGTMEEDEYTAHQRQTAKASQMVNPRPTNPTRTPPAVPYQRYPSRAKPPGNYQVPQPYGNRNPGMHYQQNGISQHSTPVQSAGHHTGYVQQSQYSQPGTPQPFPATGSSMLQQFQRSGHNGNSPHVGQRGMSPAQPLPQHYQQRPISQSYQHSQAYRASMSGPRSASPQKPSPYTQSPQRPYMSPSPNPHQQQQQQQQRYFQQPQQHAGQQGPHSSSQPAQYASFPSNQASPATPQYSNTAVTMAYARSAAEQAALMERNRAQLAEAHRQNSSTPQPVHHTLPNGQPAASQGQSGAQAPGTPGSAQNATQ